MPSGEVLPLRTDESPAGLQERLASHGAWFYRYRFDNGVETEPADGLTQAVHDTRARMIFPLLDEVVGDRWATVECVDVACHEGWFSTQLALRGAARVLGLDIRSEHVKRANVIKDIAGLTNLTFEQGDLFSLTAADLGTFDVTLFLGLLYHLDNPVGALRIARSLTREVCVIETQVARPTPPMSCLWGSGEARSGSGVAVVPSDPNHVEGGHDVVLVPTLDALIDILRAVGFQRLTTVPAAPGEFAQFVDGDRVVIFAYV